MRYRLDEITYIIGKFSSGATVILALYDLADEGVVALTSNSCGEVGALGVFAWSTANITTQPVSKKEYLWAMTDGVETQYGKIVLGGYPDDLDAAVSSRLAAASYVAPDNAGIAALPSLADVESSTILAKQITVESRLASADYVPPDNAGIAALPTLSEIESSAVLAKEATVAELATAVEIIRKATKNRIRLNQTTNRIEVYADDGETVAYEFEGFDENGDPSITSVYDRVPV